MTGKGNHLKRSIAVVVAALATAACADKESAQTVDAPQERAADTTALVVVRRATAIGFFPPAEADDTLSADSGYEEGRAHIQFALNDAAACFGADSLDTRMVVDSGVRIDRGGQIDTIRFAQVDSLSYGVILVQPSQAPKLINAFSPSQTNAAVVEAIPAYFNRPACRK